MPENPLETIQRLETLAAWHRINAEHAGADWVWEARLRTAEDLERQATEMRRSVRYCVSDGTKSSMAGRSRATKAE